MKSNKSKISCKRGFTLIELLIVVLIIGILAAIAVPLYQKAVEKSKATQALTLLKTLGHAANVYYMANGIVPQSFSELDVDLPAGWTGNTPFYSGQETYSNGECSVVLRTQEEGWESIMIGRISGKYAGAGFKWMIRPEHITQPTQEITCIELKANQPLFQPPAGDYCQKLFGGKLLQTTSGTRTYELQYS